MGLEAGVPPSAPAGYAPGPMVVERRFFLPLALAVSLASLAAPVRAQDDAETPDPDPTDALLVEALREYDTGNYEEAYALFLRVHDVRPSARTERALGNAAFELRRYRQAVEWLELAIDDTRTPLTDGMRAEVEGVLRRARAFIGHFAISTNVENATITVDGHVESDRDLFLDLGEHDIAATADGYERAGRTISVHGGEDETITLTLAREERATTVIVPRDDPGGVYRDLGWAAVVAGGAIAVGGAVSAAIWGDTVGTLNANLAIGACYADPITENVIPGEGDPRSVATCIDQENRYRLALPFAYVGLIGGGVLLATGLGLVLGAPSASAAGDGDEPTVSVACGPFAEGGVTCSGRF